MRPIDEIAERHEEWLEMSRRITGNHPNDSQELLQMVYEIIADKPEEYMKAKMPFIEAWMACTMQRNYHSKQSKWHYTYRKRQQNFVEYQDYHYIPEETEDTETEFEELMSILDERRATLTAEEDKILVVYYYSNHYAPEVYKPNAHKKDGQWKGDTIKTTIKGTSNDIGISHSTFAAIKRNAISKLKDMKRTNTMSEPDFKILIQMLVKSRYLGQMGGFSTTEYNLTQDQCMDLVEDGFELVDDYPNGFHITYENDEQEKD
tara:strand:+ start:62 stop:847 length:786 start_codon:yes stop_codon:yes gene_type:complete